MGIRQAKKKAVADAVLKSAQRLFLERGVQHTSMEAIAEAAGISRASLFNYYNGKDVIVTALAARLEPRLVQLVNHYAAKAASTGECIDALFRHLARVVEPTVELTRLLFVQGSGGQTFPQLAAALTELVARGQRNGEVRVDQEADILAELLYLQVVACLLGWQLAEGMTLAQLFQQRARLVTTNLLI